MELHLLLGIVNHLSKNPSDLWPSASFIQLQPYHGGDFKGSDYHKLLKNINILGRMAEKACAYEVFGVIETLRHFEEFVS